MQQRKFTLEDLLAGVNEDNIHAEVWQDEPRGKERL
jgi:antitoxin component of MazEF toxin-antitoxin module